MIRTIHVLAIGIDCGEWDNWRRALRNGLQSNHAGWMLTAATAPTAQKSVLYMVANEGLELVAYYGPIQCDHLKQEKDAEMIAQVLHGHPNHPWILLTSQLKHLEPIFTEQDVRVVQGTAETAVFERWSHRSEPEKISA